MAARKNRHKIILATKGGHPELSSMNIPRLTKKEVTEDLEGSLRTLKTDFIDLYWLHRDDPQRPVGEIVDMLNEFSVAGKIRYYGCSNWNPERIKKALEYSKEKGYKGFVANQMLWNIGCYHMKKPQDTTIKVFDKETYQLHMQTKITAIPFSSQANGFFTKLHKKTEIDETDPYYTKKNLSIGESLKEYCKEFGMTITELVLGYLISQKINTIPIVGCRNLEQLNDSLKAVNKVLTDDMRERIEQLIN